MKLNHLWVTLNVETLRSRETDQHTKVLLFKTALSFIYLKPRQTISPISPGHVWNYLPCMNSAWLPLGGARRNLVIALLIHGLWFSAAEVSYLRECTVHCSPNEHSVCPDSCSVNFLDYSVITNISSGSDIHNLLPFSRRCSKYYSVENLIFTLLFLSLLVVPRTFSVLSFTLFSYRVMFILVNIFNTRASFKKIVLQSKQISLVWHLLKSMVKGKVRIIMIFWKMESHRFS